MEKQNGENRKTVNQTAITETMKLLMCVMRMHRTQVEHMVTDLGIHHSQHRMLMYISHQEKLPSQRDLAEAMEISPAAVTMTLKSLEKEGYIERVMTAEDNRRNTVSITEKGQSKVDQSRTIFDSVDRTAFDEFTEEEMKQLCQFLSRIRRNLACGEYETGNKVEKENKA